MNWIESLQKAITYMEDHLGENITPKDIAQNSGYSCGYLARGFQIVSGYSFAEYIRNRRLYLAGLELSKGNLKVIEAAYKYGYDSPDAFTRAFRKFHGMTPNLASQNPDKLQIFLPLQIQINVRGGNKMNYAIQKVPAFKVIGKLCKISQEENPYKIIPEKWNEFMEELAPFMNGDPSESVPAKTIWQNNIGEYGICFDKEDGLEYMIAGKYHDGYVPEDFEVVEIPALTWAQFTCYGPLPQALQSVNTQIFTEWLPQNPDYQLDQDISVEYYESPNLDRVSSLLQTFLRELNEYLKQRLQTFMGVLKPLLSCYCCFRRPAGNYPGPWSY